MCAADGFHGRKYEVEVVDICWCGIFFAEVHVDRGGAE